MAITLYTPTSSSYLQWLLLRPPSCVMSAFREQIGPLLLVACLTGFGCIWTYKSVCMTCCTPGSCLRRQAVQLCLHVHEQCRASYSLVIAAGMLVDACCPWPPKRRREQPEVWPCQVGALHAWGLHPAAYHSEAATMVQQVDTRVHLTAL